MSGMIYGLIVAVPLLAGLLRTRAHLPDAMPMLLATSWAVLAAVGAAVGMAMAGALVGAAVPSTAQANAFLVLIGAPYLLIGLRLLSATRGGPAPAQLAPDPLSPGPQTEETSPAPTTVTESVLMMSVACEEYLLRNLEQMGRSPELTAEQRLAVMTLMEGTDDRIARLEAALERHRGQEWVRAAWHELPTVELPVFEPGLSLSSLRHDASTQARTMVEFYRRVAFYAERPSLKNLLVELGLDEQRDLALIAEAV